MLLCDCQSHSKVGEENIIFLTYEEIEFSEIM